MNLVPFKRPRRLIGGLEGEPQYQRGGQNRQELPQRARKGEHQQIQMPPRGNSGMSKKVSFPFFLFSTSFSIILIFLARFGGKYAQEQEEEDEDHADFDNRMFFLPYSFISFILINDFHSPTFSFKLTCRSSKHQKNNFE